MKRILPFLVCLCVFSMAACKQSSGGAKAQEQTTKEPAMAAPAPGGFGKPGELYPVLKGRKYGFINGQGKMVIEPQYAMASRFYDDLALVIVPDKKKCGYINREGKFEIEAKFDGGGPFSEGYASVKIKGKTGVINKKGEIVAEPVFERVGRFHDGLAAAVIEREARGIKAQDGGYINPKGIFVIHPQFDPNLTAFNDGLAGVRKIGQMWSFIDRNQKDIVPPKYFMVGQFSEGLAGAMDEGSKWGFIDKTGKYVITPKFLFVSHFSEGLAGVHTIQKKKWGFIDKTGNMVIPEQFDQIQPFEDGIAFVQRGTKAAYINKEGKYVWAPSE
ncbi:MAG TPA: WG repeat-containing protein [Bryobacteraceae bacterium]|nr:WG repeat-containing protein [Bryobacteraceae bacterium]